MHPSLKMELKIIDDQPEAAVNGCEVMFHCLEDNMCSAYLVVFNSFYGLWTLAFIT